MTLLEKRMLEKKAGNFLTDADIRNIFNQFDRCFSKTCAFALKLHESLMPVSAVVRDGNGYLGAHDLAVVYRSLGENLEDDLVRFTEKHLPSLLNIVLSLLVRACACTPSPKILECPAD